MEHQDGVRAIGVKDAVRLVSGIYFSEGNATVQFQRGETHKLRFDSERHCVLAT